jgi:hypothetical protein
VHRRLFHGGPRTGRAGGVFRHEVNGGAGRASPCGRPAARAPSRDNGSRDGTGDRRQALPATGCPGPAAGLSGSRRYPGHRRAGRVSERLTAAKRPPGQLSPNVIDTTGPALPSPRGFSAIPEPARSVCQQTPRRTSSVYVRGGLWGGRQLPGAAGCAQPAGCAAGRCVCPGSPPLAPGAALICLARCSPLTNL